MTKKIKYTKKGQPYIIDKKTGKARFIKKTKGMRKTKSNPKRPPKKWFKKMVKRVKKYDGRKYGFTPEQTVGGIWHKKLTPARRREITKRYEQRRNDPEPDWTAPPKLLGFVKKGKRFGVMYEDRQGNRYYHFFKKIPKLTKTKDGRLAFVDGIKVYTKGGISG